MLRTVALLLAAVTACRTTPAPVSQARPVDVRSLAGLWEIEIESESLLPLPFLRGKSSDMLSGSRLTLSPQRGGDSAALTVGAPDTLRGFVRIPLSDPRPQIPSELTLPAWAFIAPDGQAVVMISLNNRCFDCNDVEFIGQLEGREMTGWYTHRIDEAPTADGRRDPTRPRPGAVRRRFTMRRIAPLERN